MKGIVIDMNETDIIKVKNIIAFLSIIFAKNTDLLSVLINFSPDYVIEKYNRYIETTKDDSCWGIHPNLRNHVFNEYCKKWHIKVNNDD